MPVAVSICPLPYMQFWDNNGVPAAGYKLYSYEAGQAGVLKDTYVSSAGTTKNTNPITLDSEGRCSIWLITGGTYDLKLYSGLIGADGTTLIWEQDDVKGVNDGTTPALPFYLVSSYASLTAAVTAISSTPATLLIDTSTTVPSNTTVPATLEIIVLKQGSIAITSPKVLTINGPFSCADFQCFTGTGSVVFGTNAPPLNPWWFGTTNGIQLAVTAAGSTGSVVIPASFQYELDYTNAENICVLDYRHSALGVWSWIEPSWGGNGTLYNYGNDLVLRGRGSSDIYLEHLATECTTSTSLSVGANAAVTVSAVTQSNRGRDGSTGNIILTGDASMFSPGAQLVIARGTAKEEQVNTGNWSYVDATTLSITCAQTHSGTTTIDQMGSTMMVSHDLLNWSGLMTPTSLWNTGARIPLKIKDIGSNTICEVPGIMTFGNVDDYWKWNCIQTGTFNDTVYSGVNYEVHRMYDTNSKFVIDSTTATTLFSVNNTGVVYIAGSVYSLGGIRTGHEQLDTYSEVAGIGEVLVGCNVDEQHYHRYNDCFLTWQDTTDALNSKYTTDGANTAGSLLLASADLATGGRINFATGNIVADGNGRVWRGSIGYKGLQVAQGFGCNGKEPQTAVELSADASDLATALVLLNEIKAALIANGICKDDA